MTELYARLEAVAHPRIVAHVDVCTLAHQELSKFHAGIADRLDLDLIGHTRPAALWALSGRSLGLLRAVLVQVAAGVGCEALVTGRGLHEAPQLLLAVGDPKQETVLRTWLDDDGEEYVKPWQARAANRRMGERVTEIMAAAGIDDVVPDMAGPASDLYDMLSRAGHNRWQAVLDAVSVPLRTMSVGYDANPLDRAMYTSWATTMTSEVVTFVGDALNLFIQHGFLQRVVEPLHEQIAQVRAAHPLDREAITATVA